MPPTDLYFLHEGKYKAATYKYKHKGAIEYSDDLEPEGDFEIVEDEPSYEVPWLAVDPEKYVIIYTGIRNIHKICESMMY